MGDWQSANAELELITARMRTHPNVLKVRLAVFNRASQFELAAEISDRLAELPSEDAEVWLLRAIAKWAKMWRSCYQPPSVA